MPVHDASSAWLSSALPRFAPGAGLGVLWWLVPPGLAREVLEAARAEAAEAAGPALPALRLRLLPPLLGVYFTLGLCLFSGLPYREVLRGLPGVPDAAATALTRLRRRLGPRPFELLFGRVAGHLSPGAAPWSHVCGLLAVAWDGTTLKLPASPENKAWAGPPHGGRHYPRARLVALAACGTRCLIGAAAGPSRTGERALAAALTGYLRKSMLLLADRGFYSWSLWHAAAARAHLLWRVPSGLHLPVLRELPDGSFLARIEDPRERGNRSRKNGRRRRAGQPPDTSPLPGPATVRVIEFTVTVTGDDGTARTQRYRMITTLLDWKAAPAGELAEGYARRWAAETCFADLKARLRGPGRILRSRTPDLALQETWAYLVAYQALRAVIARTAASAGLDPARLSFTTALNAVRRTAARRTADALAHTETALLAAPVPCRPGRVRPRQLREFPAYPHAPANPRPAPRNAAYAITVTQHATPAHAPNHQPKLPPGNPKPPP